MGEPSFSGWDDLDLMTIPKFDLLGLGMLSVLGEGLKWVRERHELRLTCTVFPIGRRSTT